MRFKYLTQNWSVHCVGRSNVNSPRPAFSNRIVPMDGLAGKPLAKLCRPAGIFAATPTNGRDLVNTDAIDHFFGFFHGALGNNAIIRVKTVSAARSLSQV